MPEHAQYLRKASLILSEGATSTTPDESALDLSDMHFRFKTANADIESPNNCSIRVYNLSDKTVKQIRREFSRVILQAGYEGSFGVIFDGTIKQFRIGRENGTDTYLDILAADGDMAYNFAVVNRTLDAPNTKATDVVGALVETFKTYGVDGGYIAPPSLGGTVPNPRGKVMFGMSRVIMRQHVQTMGQTWSIQNGKVNIVPLNGYLPGEAVVLSSLTGMVGIPEQTNEGIRVRSLLNPKFIPGGLVQIDNKSINQTIFQNPDAPIPFNQWRGIQLLASVTSDGLYRIFVAEHEGDTRGQNWYTDLTCLSVDPTTNRVGHG